ncbi:MAG: mechanosensitive ion channel, partial [Muribaculaceae bacterium]|nr:mechanosensitive ion channel [Muribaculaceae bacterium]
MTTIANAIVQFSFRLCIAILVFYIGKFIIRKLYNFVFGIMVSRRVDASLTTFVLSLVRMVLYFILIITVIGIIGIETSSFLALFASAGVAIGMALSGTLQNFAGGVLILLLKPYKVGDYIEAQGFAGTVREVQIFSTIITTPDNKSITIPNGGLSTGSINNYSREDYRRVDWSIGLSYGTDFSAAKEVILSMLDSDSRVVKQSIEDDKLFVMKQEKEEERRREESLRFN